MYGTFNIRYRWYSSTVVHSGVIETNDKLTVPSTGLIRGWHLGCNFKTPGPAGGRYTTTLPFTKDDERRCQMRPLKIHSTRISNDADNNAPAVKTRNHLVKVNIVLKDFNPRDRTRTWDKNMCEKNGASSVLSLLWLAIKVQWLQEESERLQNGLGDNLSVASKADLWWSSERERQ